MSMPTAPGQNFLKITGIFYKIAGGLIIISALIVHFSNIIRSLISAPESSNTLGYIFHTADNALQIWKLTAANNVFAMLERLHNIVPALTSVSIMHSRLPERPIHLVYATYLSLPVNFTIWSFVLTFVAVIIGIFILFTGIIAVKYCDTLKHSKRVMIFALVNLGLIIAGTIFCVSFLSVLGCAIAALYFAGAFQNHITYEKTYMKTDKTPCIKKMVKYVVITAVPILCMTILFIALFQPK